MDQPTSGLSTENIERINARRSPVVDDDWLMVYPEHSAYRGDVIVHHHVEQGRYAIPVPRSAHNNSPGFAIWHQ